MSIRLIARDLYRLQREVEEAEKELDHASEAERQELEDRLRKVKAERDRMRKILEGAKEQPPYRRIF
jgi:chromosome segregation ATPase